MTVDDGGGSRNSAPDALGADNGGSGTSCCCVCRGVLVILTGLNWMEGRCGKSKNYQCDIEESRFFFFFGELKKVDESIF